MATYTPNYNLSKPESTDDMTDFFADYGDNMDIIDSNMGGGGGGASELNDLDDVNLTSPTDGQVLKYDATNQEWVNANESGGGSGGHTIIDENDISMTQRTGLQFTGNVSVTDDAVNGRTIIDILGGSGGGSSGFESEVIYQNAGSTVPSTITLSKGMSNYDAIMLSGYRRQYPTYWASSIYLSDEMTNGRVIALTDDTMYAWYTVTDDTTLTSAGANIVIDKVYGLKFGGGGNANQNIADDYDDTLTYSVGDYVINNGLLYKCETDVTVAESFDPTKWTHVVVTDEMGGGGDVADVEVNGISVVDHVTKVANVTVPTKTSDLTNDSGFIDSSALPTKVSDLTNDSGFITDNDLIPTDESAVDEFTTLNGGLLQECVVNLEPVQSGSGTPAPDNVRPISGHTEVDLLRCGKNLLPVSTIASSTVGGITYTNNYDGSWRLSGTCTNAGYVKNVDANLILPLGTYTISGMVSGNGTLRAQTMDANDAVIETANDNGSGASFTVTSSVSYVRVRFMTPSVNTVVNATIYPQIEKGSTVTSYEPYQGNLYQIQIGQTVYGGSLDVVRGVLTVTYGYIASYSGQSLPSEWVSDRDVYVSGTTPTTGAQVAYKLATPTTIQLTPQQISTLIGKNYLSAPLSGQSIDSIEYRDVFGFDDVEKATSVRVPISLLGTDEFTSTASKAYSAGDYFYKDGMMCKALTSIAKGATLTLNTNYSASTLADILKTLSQ